MILQLLFHEVKIFDSIKTKEDQKMVNTSELIDMLQEDLRNERKHLLFYIQAASLVSGPHRKEVNEFFLEEAAGELKHVADFSKMIVRLGGIPNTDVSSFDEAKEKNLETLLKQAFEMEQKVAKTYESRLKSIENLKNQNSDSTVISLFYEDQIVDSWETAKEIQLMISKD